MAHKVHCDKCNKEERVHPSYWRKAERVDPLRIVPNRWHMVELDYYEGAASRIRVYCSDECLGAGIAEYAAARAKERQEALDRRERESVEQWNLASTSGKFV